MLKILASQLSMQICHKYLFNPVILTDLNCINTKTGKSSFSKAMIILSRIQRFL